MYDAHLHVWASKEDAEAGKFPFAGGLIGAKSSSAEPPMPGHVEVLLDAMEGASVSGALIIQPGNHLYDHSYVTSVLKRYPDKFVGALLANPTSDRCVQDLEQLIVRDGFRAVRFNPYLWPEGRPMTDERGRAMYARAGQLGAPVGHMPFKGLLRHIDEIEALAREFPATRVIIDHMGFCSAATPDSEEWTRLLALAALPQVYVKTSAFFRVSAEEFPYEDARVCVRRLVDAFGAERVMWGSDFPWVTEKCGYANAWRILQEGDSRAGAPLLSAAEQEWVFGKTLCSLFPGAFGQTTSV